MYLVLEGNVEEINGVNAYVTLPPAGFVLLLSQRMHILRIINLLARTTIRRKQYSSCLTSLVYSSLTTRWVLSCYVSYIVCALMGVP